MRDILNETTMSNINNLKPFQNGYDPRRNVNGRPVGSKNLSSHFSDILQRKIADQSDKTIQDVLVEKIIKMALDGNYQMIKLIWHYQDGKPPKWKGEPRGNHQPREEKPLTPEQIAEIDRLFAPKPWPDEGRP
jgi:hypothetical protein